MKCERLESRPVVNRDRSERRTLLVKLLPRTRLLQTSPIDHADWNYRPVLGYVSRQRFRLVCSLLQRRRVHRLLEVGYGSGIFMPELRDHCDELYGIDLHGLNDRIQEILAQCGVTATLSRQNAAHTSFPDGFFDTIVAVSALEHTHEIDEAAREFERLLAPHGRLIAVIPRKSAVLDFILHIATGENAKRDFGDRRERVVPALRAYFQITREIAFWPVYTAYLFEARYKTARSPWPDRVFSPDCDVA